MIQYIDTNRIKTKNEICALVEKETNQFFTNMKLVCTANYISDELFVSRSLASSYLNQLVKDNKLIKIVSRPVYFLDKKLVESYYAVRLKKNLFVDIDEFKDAIHPIASKSNDFLKMIGHNVSLSYCINECIMSLNYPPMGLPLLLIGEKGVGKNLLGECMYEYALNKAILPKDTKFITYDCRKDDKELLKDYLFKNMDIFLYIKEIEALAIEDYSLFELFFKEQTPKHKVRILFSTTLKRESIDKKFLDMIPIHVQIPNLDERSISEKKAIISLFFKQEAEKLKKDIKISDRALNTLIDYQYEENIKQLKEVIKLSCANALIKEMEEDIIHFCRYNLPDYMLTSLQVNDKLDQDETNYIEIDEIQNDFTENIFDMYSDYIIEIYEEYIQQKQSVDTLFSALSDKTNTYFDALIYEKKYHNSKMETIESIMQKIINNISDTFGIYLSANFALILTRIVYGASLSNAFIPSKYKKNDINQLLLLFEQYYQSEMRIAKEITRMTSKMLDINIDNINLIGLALYIHLYSKNISIGNITGIIISHGYSTASSIADACTRLLGKKIFEAIDMPLDMQVVNVVKILKKYLIRRTIKNNIILLVDMGSLESIGNYLKEIPNLNIGIINNITTRIALSVGNKIIQNKDMYTILEETCQEAKTSYVIIKNQKKQKVIAFSTENGLVSTKRLMNLFFRSLPKESGIELICHDFSPYQKNIKEDPIFQEYDVILIIGSMNITVFNIQFIALEDIIVFENMSIIKSVLSHYLTEDEIIKFDKTLLSNFSLENIVSYLTILNPEKVLYAVENALSKLQKMMNTEFSSKIIIGLYIHICCLIERLITKDNVEKSIQDEILTQSTSFIEMFEISFSDLEMQYRIKIPRNEIMYVYCYINEDKKEYS